MQRRLRQVLEALCILRPDVSYVQGMNYLAFVLLQHLDPPAAVSCLVNLINRDFFTAYLAMDAAEIRLRFQLFETVFEANLPHLHKRFVNEGLLPDCYLMEWFMTLFAKHLAPNVAARVWDGYFLHGEIFVHQTAVGILKVLESQLSAMSMGDVMRLLRSPLSMLTEPAVMEATRSVVIPPAVEKFYRHKKSRASSY